MRVLFQNVFGCSIQVNVCGRRKCKLFLNAIKRRVDEERVCDIWIRCRVGRAELRTLIHAGCGRDADELRTVLGRPCDEAGRFVRAETPVGVRTAVQEQGHIGDMGQNARKAAVKKPGVVSFADREVDVHAVSGCVCKRLRREIRENTVLVCDSLDNG